jgi:hypothetical protein
MWLLGAGASRSAGMPTAYDVIWDLKRAYYCLKENQELMRIDTALGKEQFRFRKR